MQDYKNLKCLLLSPDERTSFCFVVVVPRPPQPQWTADVKNVGFRSCIQGEGLCRIGKRSQKVGAMVNRAKGIIFAWSIILSPNTSAELLNPV